MTPLEFLERLAALVPRPRLHLIRFHGVLAPNAALRGQIVPSAPDQLSAPTEADSETPYSSTRARLSWAQLLKRVFQIDMTTCSYCGGQVTLIAAIEDPAVLVKILAHFWACPPKPNPVRSQALFRFIP
jgi:hypothetical protein